MSHFQVIFFTQKLEEPLEIGSRIVVVGTPSNDLSWFSVNIGCGDISEHSDIAVHFNIRYPQRYVVRNTRCDEEWGEEETTSSRPFPFKIGQQFKLEVLVHEKETVWLVNGQHYCNYEHRDPSPLGATSVQVTNVRDALLNIEIPDSSPDSFTIHTPSIENQSDIKFTQILAKPLAIGSRIVCTGTPSKDLLWFAVNLGGEDVSANADIAVHFNARYPQQHAFLNTLCTDKWGEEETVLSRPFPFKMDQQFHIEVQVNETETVWLVNGQHYCNYEHRDPSPLGATWVQVTNVRDALLNIEIPDPSPDSLFVCSPAAEYQSDIKFTRTLTKRLAVGSRVVCTATPSKDLPWFAVNLGCGEVSSRANIAVHFNVRFPSYYVVRNTLCEDGWGEEETTSHRYFPFKFGEEFTIEVLVNEADTMWSVNGEHYCSYEHRDPSPLDATWVQVTGLRDPTLTILSSDYSDSD